MNDLNDIFEQFGKLPEETVQEEAVRLAKLRQRAESNALLDYDTEADEVEDEDEASGDE